MLDLFNVVPSETLVDTLHFNRELAQHAERLGCRRYWLAEHHNMPGIASAATAVVIGYVAAGMMMICVGAGGLILVSAAINERAARLHSLAIVAQVRETVRLNC